jgi:membrane protein implicated in regulation of membrane protease activity
VKGVTMMLWWQWAVAGLVLVGLEVLTPGGFYLMFLGLGALVVGALVGIGLVDTVWVQWLSFSVVSIVGMVFFRSPLLRWVKQRSGDGKPVDNLVGEFAFPTDPIAPGAIGRAEMRGTTWQARNATAAPIAIGTRCRVVQVDGLVVTIQPE